MELYIIGFIICAYATGTYAVKDYLIKFKVDKIPVHAQISMGMGIFVMSLIWPIVLAIWMRDVKANL